MRSALRLIVCVAQAGAFAPAWAQQASEAPRSPASEATPAQDAARSGADTGAKTEAGASGIGTATPQGGFQRASNEVVNPARGDAADPEAARRAAEERANEAWVKGIWGAP